jgi:hypothetical protein
MCIPSFEGVVVSRVMSRNWREFTEEFSEIHLSVCPMTLQRFKPGDKLYPHRDTNTFGVYGRNIQGVLEQGGSEETV